ncbi:hypothetical protein OJ252_2432 [Cryptosporidium canis]|uniref:Uncharacterized protein n=1 Tax=Cryptosporidium canis TaxID=195482 RepID=A0ABQ8P586_9CRYT|nr:hypothetical protein OJ252_2432 [Cryptosporidium canis]
MSVESHNSPNTLWIIEPSQRIRSRISQLPSMVQIPGMCSQEGADSIKKLAEKKRGYKEEGEKVTAEEKAPEPEKEQEPEASANEEQDA